MGKMAILASIAIAAFAANADIYMAGDSTMCNYNPAKQYPQQGWGQALALYMKDPSKLHNWAVGGRSAKSFKAEGRWQKIVDSLKPGDWVVVAFGHNDANKAKKERYSSPDDYKSIMRSFVEDVRAKGATPVLATSIPHSGGFSEKDGVMSVRGSAAGIGPYVAKTRELAAEMDVPLLDLNKFAAEQLPKLGLEKANALYMRIKPGEYKRLPEGLKDGCHTRDTGAYFYASAAVQMAREQKLKICELFKSQDKVAFTPYPWGGPGGDVKPLRDDFSGDEIPYAGEAAAFSWPEPTREMKPWVYNWWMGSAVDEEGLEYQCRELADKGFGGFHVIPIYGANGPDNIYRAKWTDFLSPTWIGRWNAACRLAAIHNLGIDLTMGSGWCFGGPWIDMEHAASSGMKVKRAGPGGQGFMIDPFDPEAMKQHIAAFEKHFGKGGDALRPRAFYHDSYEYYGAEPKNGQDIDESQLACFKVWTDWCRENGYLTRNEAHGAPSNWLDFYALADIPETEMFGKNDRDILISKFASSAAHVKGTRLVSAESCTWIDEHFCERPAEIKAFLDRLFLSGVNHVFYHGFCYSPVDAVWPGWCFYASLEMNPRNPIWREVGALNGYVTRCQSLFQTWTPDNDLAILWDPSAFRAKHPGKTVNMSVHARDWFYGEPIGKAAKELFEAGYAFDYVSPRMAEAGLARKYAAFVDPAEYLNAEAQRRREIVKDAKAMPFNAASGLLATRWRKDAETAYFVVNTGTVSRVVSAAAGFTAADPLSGGIAKVGAAEIRPRHSLFVVGDGFSVAAAKTAPEPGAEIAGPWKVSAVCGGPELPAPRSLGSLAGWETLDEFFSGTMLYRTSFDVDPQGGRTDGRTLSLGEVREIARVRLNGRDLGVRFMPPYDCDIPEGVLKEKGNELEIEVTNLGANRIRWNDLKGVSWKYFADINMVDINYKKFDASKWKPLASGLLGPVRLSVRAAELPL
ncbi:MAG: hypothetical protein IJI73_10685 [Kiritimatiellae bacterium]|nr:hypothetical protein [Kiritimatiellia bacterium]